MSSLPTRLQQLEARLLVLPAEGEGMLLSELDGYLAGILVCPDLIPSSEWLTLIWGGEGEDMTPPFESAEDLQEFVGLVMRHYNAVSRDLHRGPGRYTPVYDVDPRQDDVLWELWIGGFERAMALRPESWARLVDSDDEVVASAMTGLLALIALSRNDSPSDDEALADELTREALDLIPEWLDRLHAWRLRQDRSGPSVAAPSGKNRPQ